MKRKTPGLFNGWWLDMAGRKIGRIRRNEYPTLYYLERRGRELGLQKPGLGRSRLPLEADKSLALHMNMQREDRPNY